MGLITERALLWKFVPLNKRPDEVSVGEMLVPFFRIGPDESTKTAAKTMVENRITRLRVFEDEKFLGWVTLTDLAREFSKPRLLKALIAREEPEDKQVLCPNCRKDEHRGCNPEMGMPELPLLSVTLHFSEISRFSST